MGLGDVSIVVFLHILSQKIILFWQDEGFGQKVKVTTAVFGLHLGDVLVHQVLTGHVERVGEVVYLKGWNIWYFLVGQQAGVNLGLDYGAGPVYCPILVGVSLRITEFLRTWSHSRPKDTWSVWHGQSGTCKSSQLNFLRLRLSIMRTTPDHQERVRKGSIGFSRVGSRVIFPPLLFRFCCQWEMLW